jgi:adenylate cyclase
VLAIFNFPIMQEDHVRQAVLAGIEIQKRWKEASTGIGIGIHTGSASIGEVGIAYKDFTIIGPVVNLASRIQSAAGFGEIVVTEAVYDQVKDLFPQASNRSCQLKGIEEPVNGYLLGLS